MNHSFMPMPKQQPQPVPNTDPENQILCECGSDFQIRSVKMFRSPSPVVGEQQITATDTVVCGDCRKPIDVVHNKRRKDVKEV